MSPYIINFYLSISFFSYLLFHLFFLTIYDLVILTDHLASVCTLIESPCFIVALCASVLISSVYHFTKYLQYLHWTIYCIRLYKLTPFGRNLCSDCLWWVMGTMQLPPFVWEVYYPTITTRPHESHTPSDYSWLDGIHCLYGRLHTRM